MSLGAVAGPGSAAVPSPADTAFNSAIITPAGGEVSGFGTTAPVTALRAAAAAAG